MHSGFVYILSSQQNGTLYVGVTNSLSRRLEEHFDHMNPQSFTARYWLSRLVYWEPFAEITAAISREKQLKRWNRSWKMELIEKSNPTWRDLTSEFLALDPY